MNSSIEHFYLLETLKLNKSQQAQIRFKNALYEMESAELY